MRGLDSLGKEFFVLLKNTHESNYHRHDDLLFYDGEVALGDGGLYKHEEADERHKHLRSHFSHGVPYVNQKAARNKNCLLEHPSITKVGNTDSLMTSTMFGEVSTAQLMMPDFKYLILKFP